MRGLNPQLKEYFGHWEHERIKSTIKGIFRSLGDMRGLNPQLKEYFNHRGSEKSKSAIHRKRENSLLRKKRNLTPIIYRKDTKMCLFNMRVGAYPYIASLCI